MKAPTTAETMALSQATAKAEQEANSKSFYRAKDELFFCTQVVALAAVATAATKALRQFDNAGRILPKEWKHLSGLCTGHNDWEYMPEESLHWALNLAAQRMNDASDTMESAFMAAERAAEGAGHAQ